MLQTDSDLDLIAIERERRRRLATRTATPDFKTLPAHEPNPFSGSPIDTAMKEQKASEVVNVNPFQDKFTPSTNVKSMGEIAADISPQGKTGLGFGEKLARGVAAIPVGLAGAAESLATKPIDTAVGFGKGIVEHAAETAALASSKAPGAVPELAVARLALKGAEKLKVPIIGQIEPKLRELETNRIERYKEDPLQAPMDVLGLLGLPATAAWALKASKVLKAAPTRIAEVLAENATKRAEAASGKVAAQRERAFTELAQEYEPTLTKDDAKQWIDAINEYDKQAGATVGESATLPQKAPGAPPVNDLKAQIDAIVPKDIENRLAKARKGKTTSTQPADVGGTGTPGKSALEAESAPASASEGGVLNNSAEKLPTAEKTTVQEPDALGLNKDQIATIRRTTGLDELPQADRDRHIDVLNRAKANGTDRKALDIAADIKKNARPLTNEEHAGMVLKAEDLYKDWREATAAASDAIEKGLDPTEARTRANSIADDLDLLTEASDKGGREAARSLSIRRMLKSLESDDILHVRREAQAVKGSKLTPEESARFESVIAEKDAALKRLDEESNRWKAEYEKSQQELADQLVRREANKAKITERSQTKREKIASERVDILKKLKERGHEVTLNAGVNPEDAYLVGKLAINYVKSGVNNIDEVVRMVMADIPNLTKRDVLQSINSKNPDIQAKAKTAAMRKVNLIRKQAELLVKIEDAEKGIFNTARKSINTPMEIKALQAKLRELRLQSFETVRNADRLERTQKAISDVQSQLENHYRKVKAKKPTDPAELTDLRTKLKELRRTMKIEDDLARYEDQIRTGDFEVPDEVVKRKVSPSLERAEIDLKRARRKIREEIEKLRPKGKVEKVIMVGENLRAIKATADLSATLRQGAISVVSHPVLAAKNFPKSLLAAFSEFKAEALDHAMKEGPNKYLYDKGKLELSELEGVPLKREEFFAGNLIEKIPGLGHIVKGSNRHMATFLNLMRTGMFDDFVRKVPNATTEELQAYASWINVTTGRGNLGKFAQAGRALGTVFFAPRFAVSRLQTPIVFFKAMKASPRVRAQVAKEAVAVTSTALGVLALAKLSGAEVGDNPRESDFGKIRIGNERIDIFAGYQQPYRLIAKMGVGLTDRMGMTGKWLQNKETGKLLTSAEVDPLDDWIQFAMYKLSPQFQLARQLYTGENVVGQDQSRTETVIRSIVPIMAESIYDAWKLEGPGTAARSGALNLLGVSSNVYPDSAARLKRDIKKADFEGDRGREKAKKHELDKLQKSIAR